jgi:hypothetical protein
MRAFFLLSFLLSLTLGCASIADLTADEMTTVFDPSRAEVDGDRVLLGYGICQSGVCVELVHEVTKFMIQDESGEWLECIGIYLEPTWVDGTQNKWLFAFTGEGSDPRCEAAMEAAADESN